MKKRRFIRSPLFFIILAAVAGLISFGAVRAAYDEYRIQQEITSLQGEIGQLREKRMESMEMLSYVLSPDFVEEKARLELNMKRQGERVMIVDVDEGTPSAEEPAASLQNFGNPLKWWYYFTKHTIPKAS